MLLVLVISIFIMMVPQNLYNTISSKSFSTYMGIGNSDLRIDIQQTDRISEKSAEIARMMENDKSISQHVVLTTKTFKAKTENGSEERLKIELGDHSIFPVVYSKGKAPAAEDEIALSTINADELGKKVGDVVKLLIDGKERNLMVCGIYSDVTNGGKTAKAIFNDNSSDIMWSIISAKLWDESQALSKTSEYANRYDYAKVSSINEYITQTYGSTISSVGKASFTAIIVALLITIMVTLLFMKMLVAKDGYSIAVMKALGFTNSDIKAQFVSRSVFVLTVGIVLGTLLANTIGEVLVGSVIASFGASSFHFVVNPVSAYVLCPLMMMCSVLIATYLGISGAGQIKISANIKE
ncbi:FtsX-like permease family protein [compost metagenome]